MTADWPEPRPDEAARHQYLSTGCHHELEAMAAGDVERAAQLHAYCEARSGKAGAKRPAHCKWCDAPCGCPRHVPGAVPVAWSPAAGETERVLREGVVRKTAMAEHSARPAAGALAPGIYPGGVYVRSDVEWVNWHIGEGEAE